MVFAIIRDDDDELRRIHDGYPIVPVLVGDTFTIRADGKIFRRAKMTETGAHTFSDEIHGRCAVFGCEPAALEHLRQRLPTGGQYRDRAYQLLARVVNRVPGFDGTVATLPR